MHGSVIVIKQHGIVYYGNRYQELTSSSDLCLLGNKSGFISMKRTTVMFMEEPVVEIFAKEQIIWHKAVHL